MRTLKNLELKGKKVLVRCDFNVPLDEKGLISDDSRIKETLPTIEHLVKKGARVILMSHLGRPEGRAVEKLRLDPVAERLSDLLKQPVKKLDDCVGKKVEKEIESIQPGQIILLENIQFNPGENTNDSDFAKTLAGFADIFVMEAFGQSHRNYASIAGVPKYLSSVAGFLFEKEIKVLSKVLRSPWRPLVVVIGGVKIESKIGVVEQFLKSADHVLLGGEIANAILIGKGVSLSRPLPTDKEMVKKIEKIDIVSPKIHLPVDGVISLENLAEEYFRVGAIGSVRKEEKVYDIGPETIKIFSEIIKTAKMILWSGPLGLFEEKKFENGTKKTAESVVKNHLAFKIAGGGDTIAALNKLGLLNKFDHISTGGGAMLEFLSGKKLPGIEALK